MKRITFSFLAIFVIFALNGCISFQNTDSASSSLAPLTANATPEQIIAWPIIPVVKLNPTESINLKELFGDAEPAVSKFLHDYLDDFDNYQKAARRSPNPPRPDFYRHFPLIVITAQLRTLTPQQRKNLDNLFLMHNLCCRMNDVFFMFTKPFDSTDELLKAVDAASVLHKFIAENANLNLPAIAKREDDDGDPLGREWHCLFDGMKPLSPIADEWTISAQDSKSVPCKYGMPFPNLQVQSDQIVTLSIKTEIPHDGRTSIRLIAQGLPKGFYATLDGNPLKIEAGTASARIIIMPEQATGKTQTLAISWKSTLYKSQLIFRQPWFVMKN
ncbi:MAG: hypothetical protein IKP58_06085 [Victivallales bacterium]|nr:hypothetical protein [Victivallales bacterium]